MKKNTKNGGNKVTTAERLAQVIIDQLEKGVSPWHKTWKGVVPQSIHGRPYRGINALLLGLLDYEVPRYVTFNQAKKLGGMVKKGEHGHLVMFWKTGAVEEKDGKGNVILKNDGTPKMRRTFLMVPYTVFNVSQCEGLPEKFYKMDEVKKHEPIVEAEAIWNGYADKPVTEFTNGDAAFYVPGCDIINVPKMKFFDSAEEFYATLFHEGCHSTGHKKRLNRDMGGRFGSEKYGKEELVAEIGAQLLCQNCGITRTLENTAAYCEGWCKALKGMRANEIVNAASAAQKAADWILGTFKKYDDEGEAE